MIFTGGYQFIIDAWIMFSVGDDATPSLLCTAGRARWFQCRWKRRASASLAQTTTNLPRSVSGVSRSSWARDETFRCVESPPSSLSWPRCARCCWSCCGAETFHLHPLATPSSLMLLRKSSADNVGGYTRSSTTGGLSPYPCSAPRTRSASCLAQAPAPAETRRFSTSRPARDEDDDEVGGGGATVKAASSAAGSTPGERRCAGVDASHRPLSERRRWRARRCRRTRRSR